MLYANHKVFNASKNYLHSSRRPLQVENLELRFVPSTATTDTFVLGQCHEVVFIDSSLPNHQNLRDQIQILAPTTEIVEINALQNGLEQVSGFLADKSNLNAIHVLSQGQQGKLILGNSSLSTNEINSYSPYLATMAKSLAQDGDILLYDCGVSEAYVGQDFVNRLADATNADVSASANLVTTSISGGPTYVSGSIETWPFSTTILNILHFPESESSVFPSLNSAKQLLAHKALSFFSDPNSLEKLHGIFPGLTAGSNDEWRTKAQALINDILNNRYTIVVELLSNNEMIGAMGAFAETGTNGRPVIYINSDWLALAPDSQFISRVLAEEFGHSLDFALNGTQDTVGDEGFKFALELFGSDGIDTSRMNEDDHETLKVRGVDVSVEEASVTFAGAYQGTPSAWSLEASSIKLTSKINANSSDIKFISSDPTAQYFSGNNVAGSLVYINATTGVISTIKGVVSRQFKVSGATFAFYFYATGANGVVDSNGGDDSAYLLNLTTNPTTIVFDGSANATYKTSSDPVDTALNSAKDTPLPILTAATSSSTGAQVAIEAGGTTNLTLGQDGSGNVLASGLYSGFTSTPSVISAGVSTASQTKVNTGSTSTSTPTSITATFGTLKIGANGTYLYQVDNTNTSVQALRLSTDTLTETFSYTARDSSGNLASTTLTVTIQGKNDAPVALNDSNTAKIGGSAITGNVLANDSDVDKLGETINLLGLVATADLGSYTAGTTTLNFTTSNGISSTNGDNVYYLNTSDNNYYPLKSGTTLITANYNNSTNRLSLSADPTNYTIVNGTRLGFFNGTNASYPATTSGLKYADVTSTTSNAIISLTNISGSIVVGMTVSGTNIPTGALVTSISGTNIVLSKSPTGTPGSMTFIATGGSTVTGTYGTLVFNADGKGGYTYTPNSSGSGGTDTFTYKAVDAGALQSNTGTLTINILATTATNPTAVADTTAITEDVTVNTMIISTQATGLLGNDLTPSGTAISGVVSARASADASETSISSGSTVTFNGKYGSLALKSDGTYTYTLNNANPDVNNLNSGASLTDLFYYRIQNNGSSGNQDTSTLTVTINGANDAPILKLDASSSITNFSSSYTPTYTVNSTTVNAVPAPLASTTGMHLTDVDNTFFFKTDSFLHPSELCRWDLRAIAVQRRHWYKYIN